MFKPSTKLPRKKRLIMHKSSFCHKTFEKIRAVEKSGGKELFSKIYGSIYWLPGTLLSPLLNFPIKYNSNLTKKSIKKKKPETFSFINILFPFHFYNFFAINRKYLYAKKKIKNCFFVIIYLCAKNSFNMGLYDVKHNDIVNLF